MNVRSATPYQSLASIYDYVMRHVDYDDWAAYLCDLFVRCGHQSCSLVDLACGTGNIALELRALDCPVVAGVDASPAMLDVARKKAARAGYAIDFVRRDLRQLAGLGLFDTAVCMYDSLNYLLTLDDLIQALRAVQEILHSGGLFVFDVCTEQNSLRYFRDFRDQGSGPGFTYQRRSRYDVEKGLQTNHFTICFDGQPDLVEEHHVQRIYPLADILAALEESSFDLLGAFDGFTFREGTEQADRIHFALRRP